MSMTVNSSSLSSYSISSWQGMAIATASEIDSGDLLEVLANGAMANGMFGLKVAIV